MQDTLTLDAAVLLAAAATLTVLMLPAIRNRQGWRATVTPLASIIGSGFLILGPILLEAFGSAAPLAMAALCALAWAFGAAIRHNIAALDRVARGESTRSAGQRWLEEAASWALAFAYVISVAYYLNLLGAFSARAAGLSGPAGARWITSAVFLFILGLGLWRGFTALERSEQISVSLKLAIITGLLLGLAWVSVLQIGALQGPVGVDGNGAERLAYHPPAVTGWPAVTLVLGLLITVQGFETSRYLGDEYPARLRVRSMIWAQLIATAIYLAYAVAIAILFRPGTVALSETGVIDLMAMISPILPPMLTLAALSAQFSAAIADTAASGGLFVEASRRRIGLRTAYGGLVAVGLWLTWAADVFQIVAYASRAFAVYYTLQAALAALTAHQEGTGAVRVAEFSLLAALGMAVVLFGQSVEG